MKNRYTFRLLTIGTALVLGLTASAQQTPAGHPSPDSDNSQHAPQGSMPKVEQHLKVLAEKLDLTVDQQAKAKPILQEMHDAMQRIMENDGISREDRMDSMKTCFQKADKKMREFLTDDQRNKLDKLEQEMHSGPHTPA